MSPKHTESESELDVAELEVLAKTVKPAKVRGKKGKKFADKSFMLSLVDQVNLDQEQKIQQSLEREAGILKRIAHRGGKAQKRKDTKQDKIDRMKHRLQKGGGGKHGRDEDTKKSKGRGDHRDLGGAKKQDRPAGDGRRSKGVSKSEKPGSGSKFKKSDGGSKFKKSDGGSKFKKPDGGKKKRVSFK